MRACGSNAYTAPEGPAAAAKNTVKSPMLAPDDDGSSSSSSRLVSQVVHAACSCMQRHPTISTPAALHARVAVRPI
jgi:hypothetical protein